ncbi:C40 family peptidase [Brevibacterium jeotgali]|uniref:Cell wall-associated hydrolase, NlpC family n=1 Tax=Brevibacterium jeotgali TaxID=1262550 RepID=A0A2H1L4G0_9MICO|nr:C40 family peptidase [Brevibacterium jeotgali]TWB98750.1 cell wall-associated NlpC family hydrolase [Brevibacterium jeotgali]SMY11650.1 Cell wall-associated hydrolase, NlpC family [Brevibacterium jeotgali]
MATRKHGRRAAETRVKTPLTELTDALGANYGVVGRRAAVVAAAGGLVVTATLPAMGEDDAAAVTAEADDTPTTDFVNQAKTVIPEQDEDTDDADVVGAASVSNVTAEKAPEPEPEPEPTPSESVESNSGSSDSGSSDSGSSDSGSSDSGSSNSESSDSGESSDDGGAALPDGSKAEQVIAIAKQYTGVPYVYGGTSTSGWDCSGYTSFVFSKVGVNLPRSSGAQASAGQTVSASEARPGDLVYKPGHIGIYAGNGMMYDAGSSSSGTSYRSHSWMGSVTYIRVL